MKAIYKREMRSYFTSPIGYIVMIVYLALYGYLFSVMFASGSPDTSSIFSSFSSVTLFMIPVLTMRLFSEERRQKTDQALFTAPVSLTGITMGKFFAAFTVFAISQAITLVFEIIFAFNVSVDWVNYICSVVGTLLMAGALIALGIFISSLTDSQIVSAIGSLSISIVLMVLDTISSINNSAVFSKVANWISFTSRYHTFTEGIFDVANTLFFISFAAVFIFLTVRVQESKRWA